MQFMYILLFLAIQSFSLFSYEVSPDNNYQNDTPPVTISFSNNHHELPPINWSFSAHVTAVPDSYKYRANYSTVAHYGSHALKQYFRDFVMPMMYHATIKNYCYAIPGYASPHGLRDCGLHLSQFSSSDAIINDLKTRLDSYCTQIENVLFNSHGEFREKISYASRQQLAEIYGDFLKEFGAHEAPYVFYQQSLDNPFMQRCMKHIDWQWYDGKEYCNSKKTIEKRHTAALNGNLGKTYKALHEGNSEQAHTIGHERVRTVISRAIRSDKVTITSVFERYPALHKIVDQARLANQVRLEQERLAKEAALKQDAVDMQKQYQQQSGAVYFEKHFDILQDRCSFAIAQFFDPQFYQKLHQLMAEQAPYINSFHLTPDQKGILFEGGHLQHYLVDEAITVADTVISGDLIDKNMQNVVLGLANTSISLNKEGDVLMASRALDTCWALIDCAQEAAQCVYASTLNGMHPIQRGVWNGFVDSMGGVVHTVLHPIEAGKEFAQSLATAGYCLGKLAYAVGVYDAACDVLESDPKRYEQMIAQYEIDPDALAAIYEHAKNNLSVEDAVRFGTKTVIDTMLLHDVTKIVSAFAKEHWTALISCMRKGGQSTETALTAENLPVKCGEEVASIVQKMESNAHNTGAATEIITDSQTFIENVTKSIIDTEFFSNLKAIGNNLWKSPGGIIYGYDKKFGNTLNHILAHMTPNPMKKKHTVFSISKDQLVQLIDEAWAMKGNPVVFDPRAYIVDMKKMIGTQGETAIRIVLKELGTCEILTAYPITI